MNVSVYFATKMAAAKGLVGRNEVNVTKR